MKPLSEALNDWKPQAGLTPPRDPAAALAAQWDDVVGANVARNSMPARLEDQTLAITTRSSAWSHQLSLLSEEILEAVRRRLPGVTIAQLRFRVGRVAAPSAHDPAPVAERRRPRLEREPAKTLEEALARLRRDIAETRRAKQAAGWKECENCAALVSPGAAPLCIVCENARAQRKAEDVERLLFEAPWLGYSGTAEVVSGLSIEEYESIRSRLLARWWQTLSKARAAKRLSSDRRERSIASSYVVLRSKLPPEEIVPATVRNVLGDELHDLIYGMERSKTNVE